MTSTIASSRGPMSWSSPWTGQPSPRSTREVFVTDTPYPITLDLPALTARRRALLERARPQA